MVFLNSSKPLATCFLLFLLVTTPVLSEQENPRESQVSQTNIYPKSEIIKENPFAWSKERLDAALQAPVPEESLGVPLNGLQLTATLASKRDALKNTALLTVKIRNVSGSPLAINDFPFSPPGCFVIVFGKHGAGEKVQHAFEKAQPAYCAESISLVSGGIMQFEAGQEKEFVVDLKDLLLFPKSDTYQVVAKIEMPSDFLGNDSDRVSNSRKRWLYSNKVELEIR